MSDPTMISVVPDVIDLQLRPPTLLPRSGSEMVAFTDAAIQIIRHALRGGAVRVDTPQHQSAGYQAGPVPPQPIEVWVGSQRRR